MRTALSAVVALASTLQIASAGWTDASAFSCPSNTDNHCSSSQSSGFDWGSLSLGSFSSYGGFSFDGFSCASSFGGSSKRDILTGRSFQDKCITGEASSDVSSCPSFSCGGDSGVSAFSVDEFQVSVEFDCDLEFHYGMSDGSTCKQTSSCSTGGSTIKNTQCGGAKNVSIVYPSQSSGGGKSSCSIGVHSIGFDCSSASSTVYHSSTAHTSTTKPTSAATTPASSTPITTPVTSSSTTTPVSTSAQSTPIKSSPVTTPSSVQLTTSTVFTTSVSTIISCGPEVTNCPARSTVLTTVVIPVSTTICPVTATETTTPVSTPVSSAAASTTPSITSPASSAAATSSSGSETTPSVSEVITTEIVYTSTTICPVTATQTSNGVTSTSVGVSTSTILITTTSTICTKCEHSATESTLASSTPAGVTTSTAPSGPVSTAPCPDILPQCLNTWLFTTGCSSNTDSDCYCPSSSFVSSVYACLSAHGASSEISAAQSYFQGICAAHVSGNPAIVTAASTVTVTSTAGGVATSIPVTTVQILTTLTVPCTESTGISSGNVIPSSSTVTVISTAITVPQVQFTTVAGATTAAALVPATTVASQAAGVTTGVPAATTFTSVGVSNATVTSKPTSTSAIAFTGAGSKNGMAMGSIGAAVLFALFAM